MQRVSVFKRPRMSRALPLGLIVGCLASLAWTAMASAAQTCVRHGFRASVHQGPSAGLAMRGTLRLTIGRSGALNGALIQRSGRKVNRIRVVGQVQGRSISLLMKLRGRRYVAGTGTIEHPIRRCRGFIGGTLAGPFNGDIGSWDTSSFGNGMQSGGSPPVNSTPIIRNAFWSEGQLFIERQGAYVGSSGTLIIYPVFGGRAEVRMASDYTGLYLVAGPSTPFGVPLRDYFPRGVSVNIQYRADYNGKTSLTVPFTRP